MKHVIGCIWVVMMIIPAMIILIIQSLGKRPIKHKKYGPKGV